MLKPLKWSLKRTGNLTACFKGIAAGLLTVTVAWFAMPVLASAEDARSIALDLGRQFQGMYGSNEQTRDNLLMPLLDPSKTMTSMDGMQQGGVSLTGSASVNFMSLGGVLGANNEIAYLTVNQDTDFDGTINSSFSTANIAGICLNGIIRCPTEEYGSGCTYESWSTEEGSDKIQLAEVPSIMSLAGCRCVTTWCAKGAATPSLPSSLSDIGAAIIAAITKASPGIVVTEIRNDMQGQLFYMGKPVGYQNNVPGYTTPLTTTPPTGYIEPGGDPPSDFVGLTSYADYQSKAVSSQESQAGLNNGLLNILKQTDAAKRANLENAICTISRKITTKLGQDFDCLGQTNPSMLKIKNDEYRYWKVPIGEVGTGWSDENTPVCIGGVDWGYSIDHHSWTSATPYICTGKPLPPATLYNTTIDIPPGGKLLGVWLDSWGFRHGGGDHLYDYQKYGYYEQCLRYWDELVETQIDSTISCASLDENSLCTLTSEKKDDIFIWKDGRKLPFSSVPESCQTVTGTFSSYAICRPWWNVERTYSCKRESTFDLSAGLKRMQTASGSSVSSVNGNLQISYGDASLGENGEWSTENKTLDIGKEQLYGEKDKVCKVRKIGVNTTIAVQGMPRDFLSTISGSETSYRMCEPDCMVGPDEEIVTDCAEIETFNEAIAAFEVLKQAKDDIICSKTKAP